MTKVIFLFILILFLLIIPMRVEGYTNVTVTQAKSMTDLNPSLVVLDVRTQDEYNSGHIRNARLIPHTELEGRLNELNKTDEILVYCRTGVRSSTASQILTDNGFSHVYNMLDGITAWMNQGYPVYVNYSSIQEAINNATEGDTIYVSSGTYYEHVVVNKTVSLIGENATTTIIDGNKTGTDLLVTANGVTIQEFTVENGEVGVHFDWSNNSALMESNVIENIDGVLVRLSNNCTIHDSLAGNNTQRGVLITESRNFTVSNNHVFGNDWYGINANASVNGLIAQNDVYGNYYDGIGLLNSTNCIITRNNVKENVLIGVWIDSSNDNLIYHNNIVNNSIQATAFPSTNAWDDGVEGNYWSNYTGIDLNNDGVGDTSHVIDEGNQDNHPLMGILYSYSVPLGFGYGWTVTVISNSTVSNFYIAEAVISPIASSTTIDYGAWEAVPETRVIMFNVTGETGLGFCRVCIPKALMVPPYTVLINKGPATPIFYNETLFDNDTHRWIYFTYLHSTTYEVWIVGEEDATPPAIANVTQQPTKESVYPSNTVSVYANVTDDQSGVKQAILNYTTNNGTWFAVEMANLEGTVWNGTIPAFPYCTNVNYTITAEDNAGNTVTTEQLDKYQYHVIPESPSPMILPLFIMVTLLAVVLYRKSTLTSFHE